ncbi:hypothetical protein FOS14_04830 [Skermania sp. ID1734]|uniref:hypothetical protein n=1 Tax=Skermania sp. ID1734 TaxID=2597516 RepID=UPI00117F9FE9|nr:hypothetical protein [Skermania sp. ID1734]TSE01078.1 hypothetical protein FOS14_04830 [Skermania sp. ID1734]
MKRSLTCLGLAVALSFAAACGSSGSAHKQTPTVPTTLSPETSVTPTSQANAGPTVFSDDPFGDRTFLNQRHTVSSGCYEGKVRERHLADSSLPDPGVIAVSVSDPGSRWRVDAPTAPSGTEIVGSSCVITGTGDDPRITFAVLRHKKPSGLSPETWQVWLEQSRPAKSNEVTKKLVVEQPSDFDKYVYLYGTNSGVIVDAAKDGNSWTHREDDIKFFTDDSLTNTWSTVGRLEGASAATVLISKTVVVDDYGQTQFIVDNATNGNPVWSATTKTGASILSVDFLSEQGYGLSFSDLTGGVHPDAEGALWIDGETGRPVEVDNKNIHGIYIDRLSPLAIAGDTDTSGLYYSKGFEIIDRTDGSVKASIEESTADRLHINDMLIADRNLYISGASPDNSPVVDAISQATKSKSWQGIPIDRVGSTTATCGRYENYDVAIQQGPDAPDSGLFVDYYKCSHVTIAPS